MSFVLDWEPFVVDHIVLPQARAHCQMAHEQNEGKVPKLYQLNHDLFMLALLLKLKALITATLKQRTWLSPLPADANKTDLWQQNCREHARNFLRIQICVALTRIPEKTSFLSGSEY